MIKEFWLKYKWLLLNKYFLVGLFMFLWLMFFDQNNIINRVQSGMELQELKRDKLYYTEKIREIRKNKNELMSNTESLEKFAREKYRMKKDDEDLFIVVKEE